MFRVFEAETPRSETCIFSMSTRASRRPLKGYVRDSRRRKMVLDLDLNDTPPGEGRAHEETSAGVVPLEEQTSEQGGVLPPAPTIDVEAIDDEVVISSPRSYAEARNKSRRSHGVTVVLDEDSEVNEGHSEEPVTVLSLNSYNKRRRVSPSETIVISDCINLEGSHSAKTKNDPSQSAAAPQAPPKEPTFYCPVCMGQLVDEMSTKCGHIFCEKCIKAAITAQNKCPTCRRKLALKDIIRIYLPATS